MPDKSHVTMDQLRIGLYVVLDLSWFEHPFAFSHFKIKSEEQIATIRGLGLKSVRYNPAMSDNDPPPGPRSSTSLPPVPTYCSSSRLTNVRRPRNQKWSRSISISRWSRSAVKSGAAALATNRLPGAEDLERQCGLEPPDVFGCAIDGASERSVAQKRRQEAEPAHDRM